MNVIHFRKVDDMIGRRYKKAEYNNTGHSQGSIYKQDVQSRRT